MQDSNYNTLKSSLASVPAKALNYSCRLILSKNLDIKQLLTTKNGHARDYRGFAELMGFQFNDTKKFEKSDDPTLKILESWETHPDAKLDKLIDFLEEMERYDVIEALIPSLEKDAVAFKQSQSVQEVPIQVSEVTSCPVSVWIEREVLTRDDLKTGECTMYDAYVSYADEDSCFVRKLAEFLESPDIGLKLFIQGRDMLAGHSELETNIEMIKNRCNRMLIILTNNFIHSRHCAFQVRFAASLSIEQRERVLIPILLSPCETPPVLLTVSKIDFTKPYIYEWMWEKLILSLLPQGSSKKFLSSTHRFPMQACESTSLESIASNNNDPVITYPETVKLLALPCSKASLTGALVELPSSKISTESISSVVTEISCTDVSHEVSNELSCNEEPTEVLSSLSLKKSSKDPRSSSKSRSKLLKNTFYSYFRKGRSSSNLSSVSSGATSGYNSESTLSDNFECVNE